MRPEREQHGALTSRHDPMLFEGVEVAGEVLVLVAILGVLCR